MAIIKIKNQAIDLDAAEIPNLPASKITSGTFADARIADLAATKLTGTIATARLGSGTASNTTFLRGDQSYQTLSEFNDDKLVNDISTLALHQATNNNSAKYNLTNSNVDVYQDSSAIANLVNTARDTTGEYISSVVSTMPTNAKLYLTSNSAVNNSTTLTDTSGNSRPISFGGGGKNITRSDLPIGATASTKSTSAFWFDGGQKMDLDNAQWINNGGNFGTSDFTMAMWVRVNNVSATYTQLMSFGGIGSTTSYDGWSWYMGGSNINFNYRKSGSNTAIIGVAHGMTTDTWHYIVVQRSGNTFTAWRDGTLIQTATNSIDMDSYANVKFLVGENADNTRHIAGYMDSILVTSGTALYTSSFTPPTVYFGTSSSTTGNYESTAQTANASVSTISGVVTYTNTTGTNTLNTDIILQVSADNGSNYTNATLTPAGSFSSGVLQAVTNDISVTAGTQLKYKIFFANQASGSKVARINGVSLSY